MGKKDIKWSTNEGYKPPRVPELVYFITDGPSASTLASAQANGRSAHFKVMTGLLELRDLTSNPACTETPLDTPPETVIRPLLETPFDLILGISEIFSVDDAGNGLHADINAGLPSDTAAELHDIADSKLLGIDTTVNDLAGEILLQGSMLLPACVIVKSQIQRRTALWLSYNAETRTGGFAPGSHHPIIHARSVIDRIPDGSLGYYRVSGLAL